jgi:hypothetical protein
MNNVISQVAKVATAPQPKLSGEKMNQAIA